MKITAGQKKNIAKIAKKHGLKLVLLFGSFAVGKNREDSDMDIAVLGNKDISFQKSIDLIGEFSRVFHENIDLALLNHANPLLLHQVNQKPVLLFGSAKNYFSFKLYAFHRYNDYLPYFSLEARLNKKIIHQYASR